MTGRSTPRCVLGRLSVWTMEHVPSRHIDWRGRRLVVRACRRPTPAASRGTRRRGAARARIQPADPIVGAASSSRRLGAVRAARGPAGRQDGGGATSERPGQQLPRAGDAEHPHAHRLGGDPGSRGSPSTDRRRPGGPDRRPDPPHAGLPPPSRAAPPGHGPARLGRRRRRPAGPHRRASRHGSAQAVRSRSEHSPRPQPAVVGAAHGALPVGRSHRAGCEDAPRDRRRALRRRVDGRTPRSRPHGRSTVARDCPRRRPRPEHRSPMANSRAAPGPWFASCPRRPEDRSPGRPLAAELGRRSSRPAPSRSVHGTGQRDQRTGDGSTGRRVHLRPAR